MKMVSIKERISIRSMIFRLIQGFFISVSMLVFLEESSQFIFPHYTILSVLSKLVLLPISIILLALIFILKQRLYLVSSHVFLLFSLVFFWLKDQVPKGEEKFEEVSASVLFYNHNVHQFYDDTIVFNGIAKQIKESEAQIVCLQEFGLMQYWPNIRSVAEEFSKKIDLPYYDFTPTKGNVFGTAVFSKYPIQNVATVFQLLGRTNEAKMYTVDVLTQQLKFVNLHLHSFNLPSVFKDNESTVSQILNLRKEELASVLSFKSKADVLLGDFNLLPGSQLYNAIVDENYLDAQRQKGNVLEPTYPGIMNRIDYVFLRSFILIERFEMLEKAGSDHTALLVEIAF
jgi:endonuclease/exonuclease/phosphatase (EEP) superfamily protein YafD